MFEKVNMYHPDKVADRIAGAIVDLAYKQSDHPKIAVEVTVGHERCYIIAETSEELSPDAIEQIVERIAGVYHVKMKIVSQDEHLANNQQNGYRCGDNGIFKGMPITEEQQILADFAGMMAQTFKSDGKYIVNNACHLIICQSNASHEDIVKAAKDYDEEACMVINPLGYWTGGTGVDTGCANRKLGSDMGDAVTGGGLHGKDLSKADVTLNIVCHIEAQRTGRPVETSCAIGDESVVLHYNDGTFRTLPYAECVRIAKQYLADNFNGSFEKFAEYGLITPRQ